ncbi:MAG: ABC transporter permease [Caldilineaceae bacterium]
MSATSAPLASLPVSSAPDLALVNASGIPEPARSRRTPIRDLVTAVGDLWRYRNAVLQLTLRELKARYKNTVLGFFWSLLNPIAMMLVFTAVFTVFLPNNNIENYPLFVLCGILPWNFLSAGVLTGISSITSNGNLVTKVYFPREVLPISSVMANLVNFLLALCVLFVLLVVFGVGFSPWIWLLPVVILLHTAFVLGLALILSTLNVFYRDTLMVMDVVLLAWFFLTPVVYSLDALPESYTILGVTVDVQRMVYIFNPMASIISTYRDILYWGYRTDLDFFIRTAITSFAILGFGYWFFRTYSPRFGEEV